MTRLEAKLSRIIDLRNEQALLLRDLRKVVAAELRRVNALGGKARALLDSLDEDPRLKKAYPSSFADGLDNSDALPFTEDEAAELLTSDDAIETPAIGKTVRAVLKYAESE